MDTGGRAKSRANAAAPAPVKQVPALVTGRRVGRPTAGLTPFGRSVRQIWNGVVGTVTLPPELLWTVIDAE